jgi:DNA-binding SARP family transcriptional activator
MDVMPVSEQPTDTEINEFAEADLLMLIKQYLDALHQDGIGNVDFQTLVPDPPSHNTDELAAMLGTLRQEHARYKRNERLLREVRDHFIEIYERHKEQVRTFKTTLQTLMDVLNAPDTCSPVVHNPHGTQLTPLSPRRMTNARSQPKAKTCSHAHDLPKLSIACFGNFEIRRGGQLIEKCPNRSGQTILRYLLVQAGYSAPAEQLIEVIWPENAPKVARNKLHIAISALRGSLHHGLAQSAGCGYLSCKNHVYSLNPDLIHTDVEDFLSHYQRGQKGENQAYHFEQACGLFKGPFLQDEIYADWSFLLREDFNDKYIEMCKTLSKHYLHKRAYDEAANWAKLILTRDQSDECAHRLLMQIYADQGYRSKAIQQYNLCEQILSRELGVEPLQVTTEFYKSLF